MILNKTIPFEDTDDVDGEKFNSIDDETQKLHNMRIAMQNRTNQVRDEYILQLKNGLGKNIHRSLQNPDKYIPKSKTKSVFTKAKEFIVNLCNDLTRVI